MTHGLGGKKGEREMKRFFGTVVFIIVITLFVTLIATLSDEHLSISALIGAMIGAIAYEALPEGFWQALW